ncbi:MAG: cytochrome ubiquinol oxidase subunit I [Chloroherpetonaceae bacterium]|nr:cytochrome ubiquinol oxidase subunit I [Chthonomonadaceae bacterium]MDW8206416.1 cytochrome ubiquinol oxidase subunit I [Chloroherpetonaceae bacterium]
MNYPVWDVPGIGGAWVIGIIAILHVLIAWFAVGGGLYLPLAEQKLYREGREEWLPVLITHSRFFLILTGVFGALSGVGIWFAIGLVHPEATSTLIHNFVFGWAIEWVFFVVELAAAAVYYYSWNRIPRDLHLKVGYLYALSSFLTLVIINGILSFMLTPGSAWLAVAGTGQEASRFWQAFFNPTYWPSLVMRTLACLSLAGIYALITYSRVDDEALARTRTVMVRWSAQWLVPMFLLMPFVLLWFLAMTPKEGMSVLELGITTIGSGAFTQVTRIAMLTIITTVTISGVVYFFAYRFPRDLSPGHAFAILGLAVVATSSTEYARETIRKPYVIGGYMYSNGVRRSEVEKFNTQGYLTASLWKPATDDAVASGHAMFRGQCMSCHTVSGYRSMKRLLQGRDEKAIASMLEMLHRPTPDSMYVKYMPPLVGTREEREALAKFLATLTRPAPPSLAQQEKRQQVMAR